MPVELKIDAGIAFLVLDWPDRRNAMGPEEATQLAEAFRVANDRNDVSVIILESSSDTFCAGGDLVQILAMVREGEESVRRQIYGAFQGLFRTIDATVKPVITAVDGPAIGFGADLALASDVTLVGDKGWLKQGWISLGLIPATGGTRAVVQRAGMQTLVSFLAADRFGPAECAAHGLALHAPDAGLEARRMARALASHSKEALQTVKSLARIRDFDAHLEAALEAQVTFITGADFSEAARKILKRNS